MSEAQEQPPSKKERAVEASDTSQPESLPSSGANPADIQPGSQEFAKSHALLQQECDRLKVALATAAHELKTPLAVVAGYIELLLSEKVGPLNDRQRQILEDTQSNGIRLQHFINDFLTYAALETGKMTMRFEPSDLNACLREVYGFWLARFQQNGVAVYFPANHEIETFPFDYHKVQQVISNLLENSYKFTPTGGTVWITAEPHRWERASLQEQSPPGGGPNSVRVTVSDTGPGIPPEYHQEIFNDFFKIERPENHSKGMGLGLAIARRLVRAHGGKIWIESETGAGCKASFLLPLRQDDAPATDEAKNEAKGVVG